MTTTYTDLRVRDLMNAAIVPADIDALAALEIASGLYARAFAVANIDPQSPLTRPLTPSVMSLIGRELIRRGEILFYMQRRGDTLTLTPASHWNVTGNSTDPMEWLYFVDMPAPTGHRHVQVKGKDVLHFMYGVSPTQPWRGLGPLEFGKGTASLLAALEKSLLKEHRAPVANLLPIPDLSVATEEEDGENAEDETAESIKNAISSADGDAVLLPTTAGGWNQGAPERPGADWKPTRLGPAPDGNTVSLEKEIALQVLAACGCPIELVQSTSDGAQRESWRRFLHSSVSPLAVLVAEQIALKLDEPVKIGFSSLYAADTESRVRAFKSLVESGMATDKAAGISGLLALED